MVENEEHFIQQCRNTFPYQLGWETCSNHIRDELEDVAFHTYNSEHEIEEVCVRIEDWNRIFGKYELDERR